MAGGDGDKPSRRCGCCSFCSWFWLLKFLSYWHWCGHCALTGLWLRLDDLRMPCAHEPLPANRSGVKTIIAGYAKMGTRTLSRTLYELGYERSYHGEEVLMNVWHQITQEYWLRPENGGLVVPPIGRITAPMGRNYDLQVLNGTPPELLARRLSACRADAVAFDGAERLFWPIFDVSPNAKVLIMNWRSFKEARKSFYRFTMQFFPYISLVGHLDAGTNALPWNALFPLLEPLLGRPMQRQLEEGVPLVNQYQSPYMVLWLRMHAGQRYGGHWLMGLSEWTEMNEEKYAAFFERLEALVPPERRMHVDPRKTTYEELCAFLELQPCRKKGRLPRAVNLGNHELDFLPAFTMCVPVWLLIHWLNWQFFHWSLGGLWRLLGPWIAVRCRRRGKAE